MRQYIPWNASDEAYLSKWAGVKSCAELAIALERPKKAVAYKAAKMGLSLRLMGERHHSAVHSNADVELCRQLSDAGLSAAVIAEKMEIPESTVWRIVTFKIRTEG